MYPFVGTTIIAENDWVSPIPISYAYQWKRWNGWNGNKTFTNISGATNSGHLIAADDVLNLIKCTVTANTSAGTVVADTPSIGVSSYIQMTTNTSPPSMAQTTESPGHTYGIVGTNSEAITFSNGYGACMHLSPFVLTKEEEMCSVTFNGWPPPGGGTVSADGIILGLRLSTNGLPGSPPDFTGIACGLVITSAGGNTVYRRITRGEMGNCDIDNYAFATGNILRLRKSMKGLVPVIYGEVSSNNGKTFTTLQTWNIGVDRPFFMVLNACATNQAKWPSKCRFG